MGKIGVPRCSFKPQFLPQFSQELTVSIQCSIPMPAAYVKPWLSYKLFRVATTDEPFYNGPISFIVIDSWEAVSPPFRGINPKFHRGTPVLSK
jgi:hypothetical protein